MRAVNWVGIIAIIVRHAESVTECIRAYVRAYVRACIYGGVG